MRVGILGSGSMGGKLGTIFARAGHEVVFSYARDAAKLEQLAQQAGKTAQAGTPAEAARSADALLLAVHWARVDDVLAQAGSLSGKTIVTCSSPMSDDDTRMVIGHTVSGAEALADKVPGAHVISAFSTAPSEVLFAVHEARGNLERLGRFGTCLSVCALYRARVLIAANCVAEEAMPELKEWESFYVLIGSAAGALIGLQFVVLTLIAERPSLRSEEGGAAFSTPIVVHFSVALFIAALMSAPWRSAHVPRVVLGGIGLCGLLYGIAIVRHMRAQTTYKPVFADWAFNVALPAAAYAMLVASAIMANSHPHEAPFGVAAAALLLLFVGIHNSWDAISYHALAGKSDSELEK